MNDPGILSVCSLGATAYREGLRLQEALVQARAAGATGDWLLYPDHVVYANAKTRTPRRWTGPTRNWTPILAVRLNPEKRDVCSMH